MATYVLSDVHGHLAPLDRALARVSPGEGDALFVLGDMVDRGPDPVGVLRLVRGLACARVLRGNHEELMLDAITRPDDGLAVLNWGNNGGLATATGLARASREERAGLLEWVASLPSFAHVEAGGRPYLLAHAGIRPGVAPVPERWDAAGREAFLAAQDPQDLVWIREEFWGAPTGLVDRTGAGPVVVAGHTPTMLAERICDRPGAPALDASGRASVLWVGACEETGGVADRIDVDCACAAGAPQGRVAVLRLDDGEVAYEEVRDGE